MLEYNIFTLVGKKVLNTDHTNVCTPNLRDCVDVA